MIKGGLTHVFGLLQQQWHSQHFSPVLRGFFCSAAMWFCLSHFSLLLMEIWKLVDIFKKSYRGIHYILRRTLFTNLLTGHIHFNDIVKIKSLIIKLKLTNSNENMFWLCFSRQEAFLFFILCFFFSVKKWFYFILL